MFFKLFLVFAEFLMDDFTYVWNFKFTFKVLFNTYQGVSVIARKILDWHLCFMTVFYLLAHPQSLVSHAHMGLIAALYIINLFPIKSFYI